MRKFQQLYVLALSVMLLTFLGCAATPTKQGTGEVIDDAAITTKVKLAFVNDPVVKAIDVKVETFKGVVQLSGFVNTQTEINRAVEIARGTKGVKSVTNDIRLKSP